MKFGFVTCVQLGLSCIQSIYDVGGKLDLAITLHDDIASSKSGRVYLDDFCTSNAVPFIKSRHINDPEVASSIAQAGIDWLFIIGWSQIAGPAVLSAPRLGVLGMHPTLLPEGRGRAAIPWAILKGLEKTGVSLFKMDEGVDTGPIAAQVEIPLSKNITATELYSRVNDAHVQLMKKAVNQILSDQLTLTPQHDDIASVWPGRKPEDGEIDLNGSVHDAERLIRAVTRPYPGAFFHQDQLRYIVWSAVVINSFKPTSFDTHILEFSDGYLLLKEFEVSSKTV
jgi:methionyl-tRNA formyltransferase